LVNIRLPLTSFFRRSWLTRTTFRRQRTPSEKRCYASWVRRATGPIRGLASSHSPAIRTHAGTFAGFPPDLDLVTVTKALKEVQATKLSLSTFATQEVASIWRVMHTQSR
jgi:hypothetical protein